MPCQISLSARHGPLPAQTPHKAGKARRKPRTPERLHAALGRRLSALAALTLACPAPVPVFVPHHHLSELCRIDVPIAIRVVLVEHQLELLFV